MFLNNDGDTVGLVNPPGDPVESRDYPSVQSDQFVSFPLTPSGPPDPH